MTHARLLSAACTGKKAFQTPQLAFAALTRNTRRPDTRAFYRCDFCGRFHIGTRKPGMDDD
jgi:hypothetical protein